MDMSMWEPLPPGADNGTVRPLGVLASEAERAEGVDPSSTLGGASAANADPPSSSASESVDLQAKLHQMVTEMRRRQPTESQWLDHPELRRLRADVDYLTVLVEMAVEVALRAAEKAEAA